MIEKVEKVLDLAIEALSLYIEEKRTARGETLPLTEQPAAKPAGEKKARKPKAEKAETAAPASVFGTATPPAAAPTPAPAAAAAVVSVEEQLEAKRRCTEVMGLFIRRYMNASPKGLDRAKEILNRETGRAINKLEDLTYADHVKLIPVFEAELEKGAVAA